MLNLAFDPSRLARLVLGVCAFLTVSLLNFSSEALQNLELWVYDQMLELRADPDYQPGITLITISDDDLRLQQGSSVADGALANVLESLLAQRPAVIGVDLYRDIALGPETARLAELVNSHKQIILAKTYGNAAAQGIPAPPFLLDPGQAACTDIPLDSDNRVRRALLYLGDDPVCYGFGFLLATEFLAQQGILPLADPQNPEELSLGKAKLPRLKSDAGGYHDLDAAGYQILLNYHYPASAFHSYTFTAALRGQVSAVDVTGKIVLIGSVSASQKDFFPVPALFQESGSQTSPGLKLHALLVEQLLANALLKIPVLQVPPAWVVWLECALICFAGVAVAGRKQAWPLFLAWLVLGLIAISGMTLGGVLLGVWLPLLPAALGWFFAAAFTTAWLVDQENRQKRLLLQLFSCYVSGAIVDEIWQHRHEVIKQGRLVPRKITGTVFFSDLAGFTRIAESLEPEVFITWLNEYIAMVTAVIERYEGVVIRYIGDAVLAGFGVPVARDTAAGIARDAAAAARCCLEIQRELVKLNQNWQARGLPSAAMRIGLNTGPFLAGGIGTPARQEYTIHGDTVNTAARLESFRKEEVCGDVFHNPCRILISEHTAHYLPDAFHCVALGNIVFKGKTTGVEVYQLLSAKDKKLED